MIFFAACPKRAGWFVGSLHRPSPMLPVALILVLLVVLVATDSAAPGDSTEEK
jgi:hypothetical protein